LPGGNFRIKLQLLIMLTPAQLAALRQEYSERELRRNDLDPDPIRQFHAWLSEAVTCQLGEPNAMTLGTVDEHRQPWSRVVLLKGCDERGFVFFTNLDGPKSRQLAANPRASLTFWWIALERQVNVAGSVATVSREETETYFQTRPINSRLGAWASRQSEVIADRAQLERQFEEARRRFPEGNIPAPPNWGGFCVRPDTIEFWQGRRSRLHDRLRYTRSGGGAWKIDRLSP
jgi:pyridoxamine 5'-phosphate oxidase